MSCFGRKCPIWGAESGISVTKCHLDGSKCDLEERNAAFFGREWELFLGVVVFVGENELRWG